MTPAGLTRRLAVMLYDALLLAALLIVATLALLPFTGGEAVPPFVMRVWVPTVSFVFLGWFWTHGGQTLGMKAWRVRVQRADGGALSWRDALQRFAFAIPSVGLAGFGLWWTAFDRDRLALHDRLSGTKLVVLPR